MKYFLFAVCLFYAGVSYTQYAFVSTDKNEIRKFDLSGNCTSAFFTLCDGSDADITDMALDAYGKLYVLRGNSLFLFDFNNPAAGCTFITSFGSYNVKAIEIGPDAKLYAVERHILTFDFTTGVLNDVGEIPNDIPDATDIVFYFNRLYMSAINGGIYSLDYIDPKRSGFFYNPKISNLTGLLIAPARCFNATSDDLRLFAFESPGNNKTLVHIVDMESKITYYNYCTADLVITGNSGFHPATVITGQIASHSLMITPATCNKIADGQIAINMNAIPANLGSYSYSLNGGELNTTGIFNNLKGGSYVLSIHNNLGCTKDTTVSVPLLANDCTETLFVPQAFTPDGNGNNDIFRAKSSVAYPDFQMQVFDRNGLRVFQSKSILRGWDGSVNGKLQSTGIYIWLIKYTNLDGHAVYRRGQVALIH